MFKTGTKSWFYSCETRTQREKEKRNQWLSEIVTKYNEQILKEFNLDRVLPCLVCDGVFSLKEYREILSWHCYPKRVECFFLKLFSKGSSAFCAFCSHLEEFCPYLLTSVFLYYQERTHRMLQDASTSGEKAGLGAQRDPSNALDTEDQEQRHQSFNKELRLDVRIYSKEINRCGYFQRFSYTDVYLNMVYYT